MGEFPEQNNNNAATTGGRYALVSWLRPTSYWTVVVYHLPLALIAVAALLLPYCFPLGKLPLIPCTFLHLTGYPCPLCGYTRAFWAISAGEWGVALANSPLSIAVYLMTWIVFVWNGAALISGVVLSRGPRLKMGNAFRRKAITAALMLLAANWAYRLGMGWDVV